MLIEPIITTFLPTTEPKLSKQFYKNTIGLNLISEDDFAIVFETNGILLRITVVEEFVPQPFTVLGFGVENIVSQVKSLKGKGVKFERYSALDQDEFGIWTSPDKSKIAWFRDPDGNLISLTESSPKSIER